MNKTKDFYEPSIGLDIFDRLGINLYNHIESAIGETVANAYDADATFCNIYFDSSSPKFIAIGDNGKGMTKDQLSNDFMKIGESKNKIDFSNKERFKMGAKGIGKLAPLYYSKEYYIFSKGADGQINGLSFTRSKDIAATREETDSGDDKITYGFAGIVYDDLEKKAKLLANGSGTLIIPVSLTKNLPFSKSRIEKFVSTMRQKFSMPKSVNFDIKLIDIKTKKEYDLRGDLSVPSLPTTTIKAFASKEVSVNEYPSEPMFFDWKGKKSDYSVDGYFYVVSSIAGLSKEDLPKINVFAHGRLVASFEPSQVTKNRTIGTTYVGGDIEMDDLIKEGLPDITSDNREGLQITREDDDRIDFLNGLMKRHISKGISEIEKRRKANKAKEKQMDIKRKQESDYDVKKKVTSFKENLALVKKSNPDNEHIFDDMEKTFDSLSVLDNPRKGKGLIISHSAEEAGDYANFILNFLLFLGIKRKIPEITLFNTASISYGLKYGESFIRKLQDFLKIKDITVIYCLSPSFFKAWFTPFETGALFSIDLQNRARLDADKGDTIKSPNEQFSVFVPKPGSENSFEKVRPPFSQDKTIPFMNEVVSQDLESSGSILNKNYFIQMIESVLNQLGIDDFDFEHIRKSLVAFIAIPDITSGKLNDWQQEDENEEKPKK